MYLMWKLLLNTLFHSFARVTGPLFSMSASGSVGKAITYARWKGREYCREWFIPQNPQSTKQVNVRTALTLLIAYWHATAVGDKAVWDAAADPLSISGFNLYMKRGMDEYVSQLGTAVTPTSVSYTGSYPSEVWTWA